MSLGGCVGVRAHAIQATHLCSTAVVELRQAPGMTDDVPQKPPGLPPIDVREYGGKKDGERQSLDRRLFMQLLVFDAAPGHSGDSVAHGLTTLLRERQIPAVVYADTQDPHGVGLLTWSTDPAHFVKTVRPLFCMPQLATTEMRRGWAMIGRTYGQGHEPDLEHVLLRRAVENVSNEAWPWHVWYPLRRSGAFAKLGPEDVGAMMREHAQIGMAYGQQGLGHDVRLACYGMDADDNEFVIGLIGKDLHPLSHLVQAMRKTKQTSEYIVKMGPFFVGYVVARSGGPSKG